MSHTPLPTTLIIHNGSVSYGTKKIVSDVSLEIKPGIITALLGPNGAGKTTLMHACAGLNRFDKSHEQNTLVLKTVSAATNLEKLSLHERVRLGVIYLPQITSIFHELSVTENLNVIFDYHPYWEDKNREEFIAERDKYLALTGISHALEQRAGDLSGGQKRKLEISRSLLMQPRVIICDEPFAGVDPKSISEIQALFQDIAREKEIAILISDHNVDQLLTGSDYLYVMLNGEIVTEGTAEQIMHDPVTKEHYFGSQFHERMQKKIT